MERDETAERRSIVSRRRRIVGIVFLVFVIGSCLHLVTPSLKTPRLPSETGRRSLNVCEIRDAIRHYVLENGHLPPLYVDGNTAGHRASWRVLILAQLDEVSASREYDFQEAWNVRGNRTLGETFRMPHCFACRTAITEPPGKLTTIVAVVGPGTVWSGGCERSFTDVATLAPDAVMLVELADSDIHWMEPRDLSFAEFAAHCLESESDRKRLLGATVLFVDGEVWVLEDDCPEEAIGKFFTIDGAKEHDRHVVLGPYLLCKNKRAIAGVPRSRRGEELSSESPDDAPNE